MLCDHHVLAPLILINVKRGLRIERFKSLVRLRGRRFLAVVHDEVVQLLILISLLRSHISFISVQFRAILTVQFCRRQIRVDVHVYVDLVILS